MKDKKIFYSTVVFSIILAGLAAITLGFQIYRVGPQTTTTETTLFGILQFLFSVGFSWVLSKASFRREFEESQRRFAFAAYRRIREIERTCERLIARVSPVSIGQPENTTKDFEVIMQIALGIQDTVRSSIADWADIIGREIETVERIDSIKDEQLLISRSEGTDAQEFLQSDNSTENEKSIRAAALDSELKKLQESLPTSLRLAELLHNQREETREDVRNKLLSTMDDDNRIVLEGFWEDNAGFDRSIQELAPGDQVSVSINDSARRIGVLIVSDKDGHKVGMLPNSTGFRCDYSDFIWAVKHLIGKSRFEGEIISISDMNKSRRVNFIIRVNIRYPLVRVISVLPRRYRKET